MCNTPDKAGAEQRFQCLCINACRCQKGIAELPASKLGEYGIAGQSTVFEQRLAHQ